MSIWRKKGVRLPKGRLSKHRPRPPQSLQGAPQSLPSAPPRPYWWWPGTRRRVVGIVVSAVSLWLLAVSFGVLQPTPAGDRHLRLFFSVPRDISTPLAKAITSGKVFLRLEVSSEADTLPPEPFASLARVGPEGQLDGRFLHLYLSFWQDREFKIPAQFASPADRLLTLDVHTDRALDIEDMNAFKPRTRVMAWPTEMDVSLPYSYRMTTSNEPLKISVFDIQSGWDNLHIAKFRLMLQRPLKTGKGLAQLEVQQTVSLDYDDFKGLRVRLSNEMLYDRGFEDVRILVGVEDEGSPGRIGSTNASNYRKAVVERTFDGNETFGGVAVLSAQGTHAARKDLLDFMLIALGAVFGVAITWVLDPGSSRH